MSSETTKDEISKLVAEEPDGGKRAHLLIMLKMLDRLDAVTTAMSEIKDDVVDHKTRFDEHREEFLKHALDEQALLNKGRGAWWVVVGVLIIAQSVVTWQFNRFLDAFDKVIERVSQHEVYIESHKMHHQMDHQMEERGKAK